MKRRDPLTVLSGGSSAWRARWLAGLAKAGKAHGLARRDAFTPFDVTHVLVVRNVGETYNWNGYALVRLKAGRFFFLAIDHDWQSPDVREVTLRQACDDESTREALADSDLRAKTRWLRDPFRAAAALAALGTAP